MTTFVYFALVALVACTAVGLFWDYRRKYRAFEVDEPIEAPEDAPVESGRDEAKWRRAYSRA